MGCQVAKQIGERVFICPLLPDQEFTSRSQVPYCKRSDMLQQCGNELFQEQNNTSGYGAPASRRSNAATVGLIEGVGRSTNSGRAKS